ncbi:MAG: ABC transporter substrate-binding protein [PVC group bacterium]|nr:ABC transporter substrate-binding protein [PVC group bacterium]
MKDYIQGHRSCFLNSKIKKLNIVFLTGIFLIMLLMPTSTIAKEVKAYAQTYGGTLRWGTCHAPTIINPLLTTHSISMSLIDLIFNRLVRLNEKGGIDPDLAKSWEISEDGLVYTFHLRKNVRFHDGIECTAHDVKFTYDKIMDSKIDSHFRLSFDMVDSFNVVDKYIFQIKLKKPSAVLIYRLVREIAPKHLLEGTDIKNNSFNFHPIGTGPFKFKEWTKDDQITLEYNSDYYEGRPYLDKIVIKTYLDSRGSWSALMRDEVDLVWFIEMEDYDIIKNYPAFKSYAIPTGCYYSLYYNLADPILSDVKVRRAIAYGIDRNDLIEKTAFGYGSEGTGPFYPGAFGIESSPETFKYNPEKARSLLSEADWFDGDGDGIVGKEGQELELRILVDERNDMFKKIIMLIRQQLQEVGIKVRVILYEDDRTLTEEFLKKHRVQAHLKMLLSGDEMNDAAEEWCLKFKRVGKFWGCGHEEMDKLFALGDSIHNSRKKQMIYQKLNNIIYKEQYACFLYDLFCFHAVSKKFKNINKVFTNSMPVYTLKDWYFEEGDLN